MRELKNIEEKILDRALYLFGKNGSLNVPIRTIAKEAEVNVSAINYYFRSKDEMIKNVQKFYIQNTILAYSKLDNEELSDEEKLILCANEIIEYALRYPGVLVMQREAAKSDEDEEISREIIDITESLNKKLDRVLKKVITTSESRFTYVKMVFLSSIIYPTSDFNTEDFKNELINDKEKRIEYIRYILNMLKNS
ncbi:TetR/AcrR family transcriptional regulator [Terrisporobacter glycolicus]|uniref:HTH tetR-type domain-containing protein n=1 Tax=Terrisporobacter glycolicus ATCC 14880 = DSM 1288 TaxID=1121315 RepID=A0ABZ2EYF3_9FIRM|nr:TetR/AcrR family transcriptional regulator [Terrisporobacter glycolicus]